ncbi:competence type IV pilus minor pilin ComGG [Sutcliffiella sp. NPDC057660]|uniref:competence type IV pilus minor pilin ComGG n=1 Tax=Sutcliffiella sp. NPDC057660 TaxID=3346199 RepID=UPI003677A923
MNRMEKGYIFPVTLLLSLLVSSMLLHQIELYRMEKAFYTESGELFELESMMRYSWEKVEGQLEVDSFPPLSNINFPNGNAVITADEQYPVTQIKIICTTTKDRKYEAIILYERTTYRVVSWVESN